MRYRIMVFLFSFLSLAHAEYNPEVKTKGNVQTNNLVVFSDNTGRYIQGTNLDLSTLPRAMAVGTGLTNAGTTTYPTQQLTAASIASLALANTSAQLSSYNVFSSSNYFPVAQSPTFLGYGNLSYLYSSDYESSIRLSKAGLFHGIGIYFTSGGGSAIDQQFWFASTGGGDLFTIGNTLTRSYVDFSLNDQEVTNCAAITFTDGTRLTTATPASYSSPSNLAYASTITPDASVSLLRKVTLAGNLTINPPTNGAAGMVWGCYITVDGSDRTLSLHANILIPTDSSFTSPKTLSASKLYIIQLRRFDSSWGLSSLVGGF